MLTINTTDSGRWFKPGETIEGEVSWHLDDDAGAIEIRLFWYTDGKGSQDVEVVNQKHIANPDRIGGRTFRFRVPREPYSFSGKLITLAWAIELVVLPGGETERFDLLVGPQPVEVNLS
jgi:hypothetical protein